VKRVALLVVAFSLIAGVAAAQDPALEAALEADQVNQEHCANLYSAKVDTMASAMVTVAAVWQNVSQVYEETQAPYLLYWRGALAQCLGRDDSAVSDLEAFVAAQEGATMFASLVRNAQTRIRRLAGKGRVGQGAAASFLRLGAPLEVRASYLGGSGLSVLSCRDQGEGAVQVINSGCVGGSAARSAVGVLAAPLGLDVGVDGFPARAIGLGARVLVDLPVPNGTPDDRSPAPLLELQAGPQLRILDSVAAGGRGKWLRATARFAAAFGRLSPWAGQSKYVWDFGAFHDAGTWSLRHAGVAGTLGGAFEVGPASVLHLEGRFAWYVPTQGGALTRVADSSPVTIQPTDRGPDDQVLPPREEELPLEFQPDPIGSSRLHAGFRIGILVPVGRGVAIGPFFDAALQQAVIRFPDSSADVWCVHGYDPDGAALCDGSDDELRKVYSTQRDDILVRFGVTIRLGVGAQDR